MHILAIFPLELGCIMFVNGKIVDIKILLGTQNILLIEHKDHQWETILLLINP